MKIFLLTPFNNEFKDISNVIREAVHDSNNEFFSISEVKLSEDRIVDNFYKEIEKADLVIADISGQNPNVLFELGIAKSLKKPVILIAQEGSLMSAMDTLLTGSYFLFYDRNRLRDSLYYRLGSQLKGFDLTKINTLKPAKRATIFISYSHADSKYLERLIIHLKPFEKKGLMDVWSDTKIKAGDKWKEQIEKALEKSVAAVLLISADFLASDFIIDNELPPLLKLAEEKGKLILPVILKPCRFTKDENLSKFQAVNNPNTPLSKMDDNDKEEVYVKIADYLDNLLAWAIP